MKLDDQIAEAKRELALRRNVYPKWHKAGRLTHAQMERGINGMAAIVRTLIELKEAKSSCGTGSEIVDVVAAARALLDSEWITVPPGARPAPTKIEALRKALNRFEATDAADSGN